MTDAKKVTENFSHTDGWMNVLTGLGTSRDKRTAGRVISPIINVSRVQWEDLYHSDSIAAKGVDLPSGEMVREGFELKIEPEDDATPDMLDDVQSAVADVMNSMDDLKLNSVAEEALSWADVYGGSLTFLGIDDGIGGDPNRLIEPLNEENIQSFSFLKVYDRYEVNVVQRYSDPTNPKFGEPEIFQLIQTHPGGTAHAFSSTPTSTVGASVPISQGHLIHESRFERLDSRAKTSRLRRQRQNGWHDSVYVRWHEVIRDFGQSWGSVAHLMTDIAQAVYKMRGVNERLGSDTEGLMRERLKFMDMCRSSMRMVPIDAELEDFTRLATPLGGLPDVLDRLCVLLAATFDMPVSLLFGKQPGGLGSDSSGKSDTRFFYDKIRARQESQLRPYVERITRLMLRAKDGPTSGQEPENWRIEFNPLWQLDETQEAEVRLKTAQTDKLYWEMDALTDDEITKSRFGGDTYSTETTLDRRAREEEAALEADRQKEMETENQEIKAQLTAQEEQLAAQHGVFNDPNAVPPQNSQPPGNIEPE